MEVEKHEFIHIKMHSTEVSRITMLLDEVASHTSSSPDWAKKLAEELSEKIKSAKSA